MSDALALSTLETFIVSLPVRRPHRWVGLTQSVRKPYVVVKIRLSNGAVGWGEAQPLQTWGGDNGSRYGEFPASVVNILETFLAPALEGVDIRSMELVHTAMNRVVRGHPYAKAALEVALLDALGRSFGQPVYQLLGGKYRGRVQVAHSIGLMEIKDAVAEAAEVVDEGVGTLKLKIGEDAKRDVELVREVRRAVGDDIVIRVDANQGYGSWREALAAIRKMEDAGVSYVEQPVDGIESMAEVSARANVPIMADESVWTERDVVRIAAARAAEYLSTYYTKPGGLWRARRLLVVAGAHGMHSDINGSGEMGIGNAANLHLAASAPEITLAGTIPITSTADIERTRVAGRKYLDDIIELPFEYQGGYLTVPDGPGLGITVDESRIRKYLVS